MYDNFNIKVYGLIPENAKILDVGCGNGKIGLKLRKNKHPLKLVGIEINPSAANIASKIYDCVIVADLENMSKLPFQNESFDCIILADVLEHLKYPDKLLKLLFRYLGTDGILVISVPNFLFLLNRINILLGRFKYTKTGIMCFDHYRFFTYSSIIELVRKSGFIIKYSQGYFITRPILRFMDTLARISPNYFAYQFLIIARKSKISKIKYA